MVKQQQSIARQLERHNQANASYQEQGRIIIELAKNAFTFYFGQSDEAKRDLLKVLLSNFTLKGKEVKPQLHIAFALFVKVMEEKIWWTCAVGYRTWLSSHYISHRD